jgi:hypothetical protein
MPSGQFSPLPVKTFVHMKYHQALKGERFMVNQFGEGLVPTTWATGNDRTGCPFLLVVLLDLISQFSCHNSAHLI